MAEQILRLIGDEQINNLTKVSHALSGIGKLLEWAGDDIVEVDETAAIVSIIAELLASVIVEGFPDMRLADDHADRAAVTH